MARRHERLGRHKFRSAPIAVMAGGGHNCLLGVQMRQGLGIVALCPFIHAGSSRGSRGSWWRPGRGACRRL